MIQLFVSADGANGTFTLLYSGVEGSYMLANQCGGTTLHYYATTENAVGTNTTMVHNVTTTKSAPAAPIAPGLNTTSVSSLEFVIHPLPNDACDHGDDVISYTLFYSHTVGQAIGNMTAVGSVSAAVVPASLTVSGLSPSTTYYFKVSVSRRML